jgi:hypothetical protein
MLYVSHFTRIWHTRSLAGTQLTGHLFFDSGQECIPCFSVVFIEYRNILLISFNAKQYLQPKQRRYPSYELAID